MHGQVLISFCKIEGFDSVRVERDKTYLNLIQKELSLNVTQESHAAHDTDKPMIIVL